MAKGGGDGAVRFFLKEANIKLVGEIVSLKKLDVFFESINWTNKESANFFIENLGSWGCKVHSDVLLKPNVTNVALF